MITNKNKKRVVIISVVAVLLLLCMAFIIYKYTVKKQIETTVTDVIHGKQSQYISQKAADKIVDWINDGHGKIHVKKMEYYYERSMFTNPLEMSIHYYSEEKIFRDGDAIHFKVYYKFKGGHAYITKVKDNSFIDQ